MNIAKMALNEELTTQLQIMSNRAAVKVATSAEGIIADLQVYLQSNADSAQASRFWSWDGTLEG